MKKVLFTIGMGLLYFVLTLAVELLGFTSPYLWLFFAALAALISATPVLVIGSRWEKPGVFILFAIFWIGIMLILGERYRAVSFVTFACVTAIAEIIRAVTGYEKQIALKIGVSVFALMPASPIIQLWTDKQYYYEGAVEEMGQTYADTLMNLRSPLTLILIIVLTMAAGFIGACISEAIFKDKVKIH